MYRILLFFSFLCFLCGCKNEAKYSNDSYWPEITTEAKPWTRWWWLGSNVDRENLEFLLKEYADKGIGGVEITPIYGVKGEEKTDIDFLSPKWMEMLDVTVKAATKNNMGVDMNTGTGWPFGGPTITNEFAAKKFLFHHLGNLNQNQINDYILKVKNNPEEDLLALSAFNKAGERINLLESGVKITDISAKGRKIIVASQINTGQKVKRAAPGGEGLVFNHFSKKSTEHYLQKFDKAFTQNPGIRSFFNDSYEVFGCNSSQELFEYFKRTKGYDLALYTKELSGKGDSELIARIKSDYRDVLGEMVLENFTNTWSKWANKHAAITRNQAHGSPGNLIDLYAAVGIPELETFHSTNFPFLQSYIDKSSARHTESNQLFKKFASSAAHQNGEKLISCETHTWLNEHFQTPLYQCKPELDELFVKGVTHLFFHGTAYSPKRAGWPGWSFYASTHIDPNNPQWDHIGSMNQYIARCQSVLQQGVHTNDFLIYWSPNDYNFDAEQLDKKLTLHNSNEWVNMPEADELLEKGYQFDFTTDRIIQNHMKVENGQIKTYNKSFYKTIVVPKIDRIRLSTFKVLLSLANQGATVIFSNWPKTVVGFQEYQTKEKELIDLIANIKLKGNSDLKNTVWGKGNIYVGNIQMILDKIGVNREKLMDYKVKNISRKTEDGYFYFVANHENEIIDREIEFKFGAEKVLFMNPLNGEVHKAKSKYNGKNAKVHVYLQPGSSMIIRFTNKAVDSVKDFEYPQVNRIQDLKGEWSFNALKGGPELPPSKKMEELSFWTDFKEDSFRQFAGMGQYSTSFVLDQKTTNRYVLKFSEVETTAKVFINEKEAGTLWCFPYELNVTDYLQNGQNKLRIEVCNLGANRIRYMDQQGIEWKKFHNINIVDLNYEKFDASNWDILPSGLNGKVELLKLN